MVSVKCCASHPPIFRFSNPLRGVRRGALLPFDFLLRSGALQAPVSPFLTSSHQECCKSPRGLIWTSCPPGGARESGAPGGSWFPKIMVGTWPTMEPRQRSRYGLRAERIGEASHPGPVLSAAAREVVAQPGHAAKAAASLALSLAERIGPGAPTTRYQTG